MVQTELVAAGVVDFLQVVLCSVEETVTQGNLLLLVFAAAVPVPCVFTRAELQPVGFDDPEDESRLTATVSHFSLVVHDGWIDALFEPCGCFFRWKSIDTGFKPGHNQHYIVHEREVIFRPASSVKLSELSQADYLLRLTQLVEFVCIPQQRDATSIPEIVIHEW